MTNSSPLQSKAIFNIVAALLYTKVTLNTTLQCEATLPMLVRHPEIARHVRELIVRPRPQGNSPASHYQGSLETSSAVRALASTLRMDALTTFAWDDEELPYDDDMWFALRMGCPQLKCISTTVGPSGFNPQSHLFDFTDLSGFSLRCSSPAFFDESEALDALWKMLIHRCPNLVELSLDAQSTLPMSPSTLVSGRWPKLQRLSLGELVVDWGPSPTGPDSKRPFIEFLQAHPLLTSLSISRRTVDPIHLASLDADALPELTAFTGTLQQLQALPGIHASLKTVCFRESMQTREITAPAVASVLSALTSLSRLKISFKLHSMYDSGNLLRSLISSCPYLKHLELTCGHKPSFQLDAFSKTIRGFPRLRTLNLTIVRYPGGDSLGVGARQIAVSNPRLEKFSLTFLPPTHPLPLPFAFPLPLFTFPLKVRDSGTFSLVVDEYSLPLTLRATEKRRIFWPFGLGSLTQTKRWTTDLRPAGSPNRTRVSDTVGLKGTFRQVWSLLQEGGQAGEEMRLMLFCLSLVALAVWGLCGGMGR